MNYLLSAPEEKLNKEAFGELPGPRGIIVSSLCRSTNQRFAVICKGDFPFPFQTSDQNIELEVKSRMQAIDFYCKKCRKSMRISYALTGDRTAPAMNGIMIKCQSSDPQEFHRGADRRENGCSRKVLLISFSNKNEIKRA